MYANQCPSCTEYDNLCLIFNSCTLFHCLCLTNARIGRHYSNRRSQKSPRCHDHHIIRHQRRKKGIVRPSREHFAKRSSRLQIRYRIRISKKISDALACFIFNARFSYFQEKNSYSKSNDWGYAIALLGVLCLLA